MRMRIPSIMAIKEATCHMQCSSKNLNYIDISKDLLLHHMKLLSILSLILLSALSVQAALAKEKSGKVPATAGQLSFTISNSTVGNLLKELVQDLKMIVKQQGEF